MIERLRLSDVRNHASRLFEVARPAVVLTGPNGAGKTNVLEAVSLLAPGRGLRQAPLSQVARHGGPGGFAVNARLADGTAIGTGTLAAAPERRQVRINGASAPVAALAERLAVLWLTPAMDRLFVDSPGGRRRFLDRLVLALEPGHAGHAARYEAAMRARNKLLGDLASADREWLGALEAAMAEHGAAVAAARARTVAALSARLAEAPPADFPLAGVALGGAGRDGLADGADEAVSAAALAAARARDAAAGRATLGPHRQDLVVTHLAKDEPAALGSTGEQKALLLGLVLAHADLVEERRGLAPVLLLDEVAAHLDPARRRALFARLEGRGQVWMTGTEPALFDAIDPARATFLCLPDDGA